VHPKSGSWLSDGSSAGSAAGSLIVAVDGGASKTDVWVVDSGGALLGRAQGGGSNHQFSGIDGAMQALGTTIESALENAGLDPQARPAAATGVYCMAGVDLQVDDERLTGAIRGGGWSARDLLHNDTLAVLRAGARSGWGVAVVCGSGLNCVGRGPDGSVERFPSLAELSGDFAPGGSWLGVRTLGLALRARDGRGGPTALAVLVPAHFGLDDPEAVLSAVYTGTLEYGRLFELARVCLDAAASGDRAAIDAAGILADEVVAMVAALVGRLDLGGQPVEVVLGGGLFDSTYRPFAERVESGVLLTAPRATFRRLGTAPVLGAALLGLDAVGAPTVAEDRLRAAATEGGSADQAPV
jgi:N-acetylglucosamine kinase-like BadF-type ATPase